MIDQSRLRKNRKESPWSRSIRKHSLDQLLYKKQMEPGVVINVALHV